VTERTHQQKLRQYSQPGRVMWKAADHIDKLEAAIREAIGCGDPHTAFEIIEAALPSEPELKPCPFCGGKAEAMTNMGDYTYYRCKKCLVRTHDCSCETEPEAREAWNRRTK